MARNNLIDKKAIIIMKALALNGFASKYTLAGRSSGKTKAGITEIPRSTILERLSILCDNGYVKKCGQQTKPPSSPGRPKTQKNSLQIKHENVDLYCLTWRGLERIFMADREVRQKWGTVQQYYPNETFNPWFSFASEWENNQKLSQIFPLKIKYCLSPTNHYKPSASLFVESIIFSTAKEGIFTEGLSEAIGLIGKYDDRLDFDLKRVLNKVIPVYQTVVQQGNKFKEILHSYPQLSSKFEKTN
ncbi:MAG: hypothetical protein NWE93_04700 [Candidatus Bathyarchaeota archaeon]|nr:hypothetical protein [Candidatus Bathyarchaeota archaeon]